MYHRGCWHIVGRCFFYRYRHNRSCRKRFTTQKAFVHCARFPPAASRRSLDRVSVPVWLIVLSDQLSVVALVGRYPANKLMDREPLPKRKNISFIDHAIIERHPVLAPVSRCYPSLRGRLLT